MVAIIMSPLAQAEFHLGLEYSMLDVKYNKKVGVNTFSLVGGTHFNAYTSVEGRLGFGVSSDSESDVDIYYGLYGKVGIPYEKVYPYALLGVTRMQGKDEQGVEHNESDVSYGVGVSYNIDGRSSIGVQYLDLIDSNEKSARGVSLVYLQTY